MSEQLYSTQNLVGGLLRIWRSAVLTFLEKVSNITFVMLVDVKKKKVGTTLQGQQLTAHMSGCEGRATVLHSDSNKQDWLTTCTDGCQVWSCLDNAFKSAGLSQVKRSAPTDRLILKHHCTSYVHSSSPPVMLLLCCLSFDHHTQNRPVEKHSVQLIIQSIQVLNNLQCIQLSAHTLLVLWPHHHINHVLQKRHCLPIPQQIQILSRPLWNCLSKHIRHCINLLMFTSLNSFRTLICNMWSVWQTVRQSDSQTEGQTNRYSIL